MKNKQPKQTPNSSQPIKVIEVGKFYFIHDGTTTGHPGLVLTANDEANRYLVARFDSDKFGEITKMQRGIRHITKLKYPTSNLVANSYVHNRPMLCKRKDIGKELLELSISPEDKQIISNVSLANPEYGPSLKKAK
jgi:hypothetical protein